MPHQSSRRYSRPGDRTSALHQLAPDLPTIGRFVDRIARRGHVRCCYEAGPCGFELQRFLQARHVPCDVIAPALIPRRAGVRIKTDRRDATQLAILYRAGALTTVHVPTEHEEAARDLLRCREDIRADLLRARHRLSKFLLRHGRRWTQTKAWSKRHVVWLQTQRWPIPALEHTFQAYRRAVDETVTRLRAVETDLRDLLTLEPLRDQVVRLRCFRGMDDLTALTIAAEVGDATRVARARHFMGFTGLVPSEHSSGTGRHQGGITKTGNAHLRRVLVEAAWHYRHRPMLGHALRSASGARLPRRSSTWVAQHRLHQRYRRLLGRGKRPQVVVTAVARERAGFTWAVWVQWSDRLTSKGRHPREFYAIEDFGFRIRAVSAEAAPDDSRSCGFDPRISE